MKRIPDNVTQLAFEINDNKPLSKEQLAICDEWVSGKAKDYMKVSINDPRLLEYAGLYDRLEEEKETKWKELQIKRIVS